MKPIHALFVLAIFLLPQCAVAESAQETATQQQRFDCAVDEPHGTTMQCPGAGIDKTVWVYPHLFRGSVYPSGLNAKALLSCLVPSKAGPADCILLRRKS
ncbi:MAG: hypothetical protein JO019_01440 [Candidatus Kaiserbacteria bacterium]|nr:hypothetical protein [Candidatus Kaiserbacteria bacterium]